MIEEVCNLNTHKNKILKKSLEDIHNSRSGKYGNVLNDRCRCLILTTIGSSLWKCKFFLADSGDVLLRDADLLRAEGLLNRLVRGHVRVPQILGELAEVIDVIVVLPHLPRVEMHWVDLDLSLMTSSHDITHTHSIIFQFFSKSHDCESHLAFYK